MEDTVRDGANKTPFKTPDPKNHQPWCNAARGERTCTLDTCAALHAQEENWPNWYKIHGADIAKKKSFTCARIDSNTPNGPFFPIRFTTTQNMPIFCTEPLTISENINISFTPDFKRPQTRAFTFISFLNVPLEIEGNEMTRYLKWYCDVHGVHYPKQRIGDIT